MSEAVKAQLEVKVKCQQIQQSLKELHDWEQEMKQKKENQSRKEQEEKRSPPIRSRVEEMNKFTEDQFIYEKQQTSVRTKDVEEAEQLNKKGIDLYRKTKAGADASMYNEKCDLDAIDMFTQAIELNSQNPSYYVNRALCYYKLERFEDCIADCNVAIELDSKFVDAYYRRMLAYECMGNSQSSYLECQNIMKMTTDSSLLARTKHDMERIGKRLKETADKYKDLGNKHLSAKDYQQANEYFSKAIAACAFEPIYYHNRSLAYYHLKEYDSCLSDCNKAIELDENYFRPYYRRACVLEQRTDYKGAIRDLKKFIELVKDDKQRVTAEKDLERLNRILHKDTHSESYNWNDLKQNASAVDFIQKPPHLRSKKQLKRIPISEVSAADSNVNSSNYVIASNYEKIPDYVIDKIFNNNTGERVDEPKEETKLEHLFPSSSMPKLKQFFSPPVTPSSPPSEPIGKQMAGTDVAVIGDGNKTQSSVSKVTNTASKSSTTSAVPKTVPHSAAEKAKEEKDKINQGNCPTETKTEAAAPLASEPEIQPKSHEKPTGLSGRANPYPSIPSSSVKFYHTWCNMKTAEEKYQFLKNLENASLSKLLGVNMSSDMLSDMLKVLQQFCLRDKSSPIKILSEIAKNSEAGILFMMLGERDKYAFIQLLELMEELKDDKNQIIEIKKRLII